MRRVSIGLYFSGHLDDLERTLTHLRANTTRAASLVLLADGPDPADKIGMRAFADIFHLVTPVREGPAACFNRLASSSRAEALVFFESGTIVSSGWLDRLISDLDSDPRNGIVIPARAENAVFGVTREVFRTIGAAGPATEESGEWISDYCQKARTAGFAVARSHVDIERLAPVTISEPRRTLRQINPVATRQTSPVFESHESRAEPGTITVAADYTVSTGYGSMSEYLVLGMSRAGARINLHPLALNREGLSDEFGVLLRSSRKVLSDPVLFYSWPQPALQSFVSRTDLFISTMWESSRLPEGWAERMNVAKAVIVPTPFVAQVFRESGVRSPIEVVPCGVDPTVYHWLDRPIGAGLTTLTIGPLDNRKNVRTGIAAWKQAFANDPDARLIIKTQYNYQNYVPDDPRIRYVDRVEPTRGILHWYRQADVLLALGSEGFGLPLVEAMATGLPVIALNSEGQARVCEEAGDLLLPVPPARWEIYNSSFGACGVHGVPDVSTVADRLKWVASHREEARDMGIAASRWALRHRNVWNIGPAVLDVIDRYSRLPVSRRTTTLWVPSWGGRCGIAEYTAHLNEYLPPSIKVSPQQPDLPGLRLLHIQHHSAIFHDTQLAASVARTRQAGIPVVVTEHAVGLHTRAWEQDATALVALNSLGVARLRESWPAKQIEYIPHGCPTWFPPRKTSRGRVIGAFGFLAPHKGFWRLLSLLRQIEGSELLLYSSTQSPEILANWDRATAGLPVRWIRDYLPATEIARRLAAEADVLAFWYDEMEDYSASGAVRIGLATGVPVLASSTSWFHDLREVTYQPVNLVEGMRCLLEDSELRKRVTAQARDFCEENSWPRIAERHLSFWRSLQ